MRKRSENVGCGSYMRNASKWQRESDIKNKPNEAHGFWNKPNTKNKNSIKFEQRYYPERYSN